MDTTKTITHLSLCSGYEGIGLGLRRVLPNLREIAYVEIEAFAITNLVAKMEAQQLDPAPIFTDLKTFPYEQFCGKVDILSGGFPCQPFSSAGKRKATDDPRHLFPFIAEGIRKCQPRILFLENVQGILSCKTGDGEPVLQYVLRELEQMGYQATAGIFSAEEVGAPHQRKRVFILGLANSERNRMRGRRSSEGRRDDPKWIQSHEGEWDELRSEVKGRSNTSRGEELGYASSNGYEDRCTDAVREERKSQEGRVQEPQRGSNATPKLADTNNKGLEGYGGHQKLEEYKESSDIFTKTNWPSRPSQAQYEWEEPRVVGNTKNFSGNVSQNNRELGQSTNGQSRGATRERISRQQTESQLGRTTDGTTSRVDAITNRVDRLRLLGNGVVNQTAAKAFVTLINQIFND